MTSNLRHCAYMSVLIWPANLACTAWHVESSSDGRNACAHAKTSGDRVGLQLQQGLSEAQQARLDALLLQGSLRQLNVWLQQANNNLSPLQSMPIECPIMAGHLSAFQSARAAACMVAAATCKLLICIVPLSSRAYCSWKLGGAILPCIWSTWPPPCAVELRRRQWLSLHGHSSSHAARPSTAEQLGT